MSNSPPKLQVSSPQLFSCFVSDLDQALSCMSREDPSLRVSLDKDTGQVSSLPRLPMTSLSCPFTYITNMTLFLSPPSVWHTQTVLSGMGELHLEVVQDRLQRYYRVPCQLGPLQVAYKEAPATSCTITSRPAACRHQ